MNAIKWTPKAAKQLRKLDRQYQVQVRDAAKSLEAMPNCRNVKALASHAFG
jgi:mRNA interferase RelE/StbE